MCCAASCAAPCAMPQLLGAREPLMYRLVPALVARDGHGLSRTRARRGADRRDAAARGDALPQDAGARPWRCSRRRRRTWRDGDMLDGETAFKLYDTYGFPLDLTQDALRQRGISVDLDGFDDAMERQKAEARATWAGSGEAADGERSGSAIRERVGATEFLGYEHRSGRRRGQALVVDGAEVDRARRGRRGRRRRQPDAVLRRVRRPGRRHRRRSRGDGVTVDVTDTQKKADGAVRPSRQGDRRRR